MNPELKPYLLRGYTLRPDVYVREHVVYIMDKEKTLLCSPMVYNKLKAHIDIQNQFNNDLDSLLKD